jgi:hypothetical protein
MDGARVFGLFLGSFMVTHEVPAEISLRRLAEDVRQQTLPVKRCRLYLAAPMELAFASLMLKFSSPMQRKKFYSKNYPLWGGITNMNLNSLWDQKDANAPLDYIRGVSTGPVTPLVLSVTTIGDRVNLGVSYRTAAFSAIDIEEFQARFHDHLQETRSEA